MSAYIVDRAHIDALVTLAVKGPAETRRGDWLRMSWYERRDGMVIPHRADYDTADELGAMLWAENVGNVAALYPNRDPLALTVDDVAGYVWSMSAPQLPAVEGLKALDGFEYQCADRESWHTSSAQAFGHWLRRNLVASLPGYDAAPWAICGRDTARV